MAHDENETCVVGDYVKIDASKSYSKLKHYSLAEIVKPAKRVIDPFGKLHTEPIDIKKTVPGHYNMELYK
jgi:small subunit ribosomal protein S17